MTTTTELNFANFSSDYAILVRRTVASSQENVRQVLACSEGARWNHNQGCTNSSRPSTSKGALSAATTVIALAPETEWEDEIAEPLFGAHLRRAIRTIRTAMRR